MEDLERPAGFPLPKQRVTGRRGWKGRGKEPKF